tara:strand:+ start:1039 stop:2289 length:1251 start_codon:yes stop_codon:yes gene_type:complete
MARLSPTTAEQRAEYLSDTFKLITPGFISQRITLNGVDLCLRSPFPSDYEFLDLVFESGGLKWTRHLLARLTWAIDGLVVFDDENARQEIRSLYETLPEHVYSTLYGVAAELIQRMVKARGHIVYYLYEDVSRDLWRGLGKQSPNQDHLTGMKGLETLGLNASQRIWIAWNHAEDMRLQDEFAWTCTKQSIAPHAPKAIEKMNKQEQQQEETRKRDRMKKQDEWYYKLMGVLDKDGKIITRDGDAIDPYAGDQVSMAYTSDELADEMRRWVSGEMDWHDSVVKGYKDQIRENMLAERMQREERLAEAAQEIQEREENLGIRTRNRLVGYTPQQLSEMMQNSGRDLSNPGARTVSYSPSRKQASFDKWVDGEIDSGALVVEDGKLVPKKEIPKPQKDNRSLQSKINSRLPRYDGGTD